MKNKTLLGLLNYLNRIKCVIKNKNLFVLDKDGKYFQLFNHEDLFVYLANLGQFTKLSNVKELGENAILLDMNANINVDDPPVKND